MLIKTLPVGQLETNCYIVTDEKTLHCAVIDPGDESNTILDYIESNKLQVKAIMLTHGHFDHRLAVPAICEATGLPVMINKNDVDIARNHDQFKLPADANVHYYAEGDTVEVGSSKFTVIETPGHSPGSVTLKCENALFTGDTLFRGSCGRTDLGGGDIKKLMRSLKRLSALEGDFEVYPGHMDSSTLDRERSFNEYVRYANEEFDDR
jgi:glyoxylase-like metal-dependent hydrolase (beta-lactamase superfamily II)